MSTTSQYTNQRKRKIALLTRQMKKEGFEFKKAIRNTLTFRNPKTGEKVRKVIGDKL